MSANANPKVSLAISFDALAGFNRPAKVIVKLTIPRLLIPKSKVEITNVLKSQKIQPTKEIRHASLSQKIMLKTWMPFSPHNPKKQAWDTYYTY